MPVYVGFFLHARVDQCPVYPCQQRRSYLAQFNQHVQAFETDEVPGAQVRARFQGIESEVTTDEEGYFSFEIEPVRSLEANQWQQVELELLDPPSPKEHPVRATAQVLVPSATAKFGIISDIDDTVISSNVSNKLKMILTVILSNEHTRKPFEGVAGPLPRIAEGHDRRRRQSDLLCLE